MGFIVISIAAFIASLLTFFAGFGLGTILLPVFALWFPIDLSVALTAVVHLLNNIFKLVLVGKYANKSVVIRFGIPGVISAFIGAAILVKVSGLSPIITYEMFSKTVVVTPVKMIIAILMLTFTFFEVIPRLKNMQFDPGYLSLGGALSGLFGGLSGHQGALRSAFLIKVGLTKESFIATGTVIACLIDFARIVVYAGHFSKEGFSDNIAITIAVTLSAFAGAYIGSKVLKKVTMGAVHAIVSVSLCVLAVALGLGFI